MLQEIANANWANIWAAITAVSTTMAVVVAALAMVRWRKQDELKVKMAFKSSIANYAWHLSAISEPEKNRKPTEKEYEDASIAFYTCMTNWQMCEGLLASNNSVIENWAFLIEHHRALRTGSIHSNVMLEACDRIISVKFVFK